MAIKITIQLRETAPPHLYLDQIKELIKNDESLHPKLKGALQLMKKARSPFIVLAGAKEIVYVPEKGMHFERAVQPQITGWSRVDWSEEEIKEFEENPKGHLRETLNFFKALGYDFIDEEYFNPVDVDELIELTTPKKKTQREKQKEENKMKKLSKVFEGMGDSMSESLTGKKK